MTRGTAVLFTNGKSISSCEFNGDMYLNPQGNGTALLSQLESVKTRTDFIESVVRFNVEHFGYNDIPLLYYVKRFSIIVFREKTYYRDWFSDFLYFINLSRRTIRFIDRDNKGLNLYTGEIMVFYFGRFYQLSNNFKAYERQAEQVPA